MPAFLTEDFRFERRMENAVPIDFENVEEICRIDRCEREDGMVVVSEGVEKRRHAGAFQFGEGRLDRKVKRAFADTMFDDVLDAGTILWNGKKACGAEIFRVVAFEAEHFHAAWMAESLGRDAKLRDFRC